jgi:hypothetical protein
LIAGKPSTGFAMLFLSKTGIDNQCFPTAQEWLAVTRLYRGIVAPHRMACDLHDLSHLPNTPGSTPAIPGKCAKSVRSTMEKIKQKEPAAPTARHHEHHESAYRPEPMSMLPSDEVRRQLGWFLVSSERERGE